MRKILSTHHFKYYFSYNTFACVLVMMFLLNACQKNYDNGKGGFGNGSAVLKISTGGITEPKDESSAMNVQSSSASSQTLHASFDKQLTLVATLQKNVSTGPGTLASGTNVLATGTSYRVIAYKGASAQDVTPANYVGDAVFKVGKESGSQLRLPAGNYFFVAYSYHDSTSISDGFNGTQTSIPGTLSSPTDVLWFGKAVTLVDGDNNLLITFSHVFSQVQVVFDISAVATNLNACSAIVTPAKSANVSLATGTASTATSGSPTQTLSWTNPTGTSATSNNTIVYTAGSAPTVTFPIGAVTLVRDGNTVSNKTALTFNFSKALQAGYSYTLNVTINSLLNMITCSDKTNSYGYSPAYKTGGAGIVFNASSNFGPNGVYKTKENFNYIWPTDYGNAFATGTDAYKWLTGIGNNGQVADIVYIAYYTGYSPDAPTVASLLKTYLSKGGVLVAFLDAADKGQDMQQALGRAIFGSSVSGGQVGSGGDIFRFPAQGLTDPALQTALDKYANDPILNGPFGDVRKGQWGEDAGATTYVTGLPTSDTNLTIYSSCTNISATNPTDYSSYISGYRYQNNDYSIVCFGDGGLMAGGSGGTLYNGTANCPFYWDLTTLLPVVKPGYGNSTNKFDVYNSIVYCNIMAWAISRSEALRAKRESYIGK